MKVPIILVLCTDILVVSSIELRPQDMPTGYWPEQVDWVDDTTDTTILLREFYSRRDGHAVGWEVETVIAPDSTEIWLQHWRHVTGETWKLINQTRLEGSTAGLHTIQFNSYTTYWVGSGDRMAITWRGDAALAYYNETTVCSGGETPRIYQAPPNPLDLDTQLVFSLVEDQCRYYRIKAYTRPNYDMLHIWNGNWFYGWVSWNSGGGLKLEPHSPFYVSGEIFWWKVSLGYSISGTRLALQVWRHVEGENYQLKGEYFYPAVGGGDRAHNLPTDDRILVQRGEILAHASYGYDALKHQGRSCTWPWENFRHKGIPSGLKIGDIVTMNPSGCTNWRQQVQVKTPVYIREVSLWPPCSLSYEATFYDTSILYDDNMDTCLQISTVTTMMLMYIKFSLITYNEYFIVIIHLKDATCNNETLTMQSNKYESYEYNVADRYSAMSGHFCQMMSEETSVTSSCTFECTPKGMLGEAIEARLFLNLRMIVLEHPDAKLCDFTLVGHEQAFPPF